MTDPSTMGKKGGDARAKSLSKSERSAIARQAAESRWGLKPLPRATHGSADQPLRIGTLALECYVLEDGTRVLTQGGFLAALGRHRKARVRQDAEDKTPPILYGKGIKPFISKDLLEKSKPIQFITPGGSKASGYRADLLPAVCEAYLEARANGALPHVQMHVAKQAEIVVRALAHVGIIALVDEATGYQADRARDALAKILEKFVAKELQKWVKTFPAEFYSEMFRLWEMPYGGTVRKPGVVGTLTNNLVYSRLAPGVLEELKRKNPRNEAGNRTHKHHQHLTNDIGHPRLLQHLAAVVALMKASKTKDQFMDLIDRALPRYTDAPLFNQPKELPDAAGS
ncbi:MAG: P63C domain-containing protein [Phycisphaeraceae bacterium]|nr:P63C domain-containing protein [Phycisphaeraceae bacterium]